MLRLQIPKGFAHLASRHARCAALTSASIAVSTGASPVVDQALASRCRRASTAAAPGGTGAGGPKAGPQLVNLSGAPITASKAASGSEPSLGAEVELNAQNVSGILQSPNPILLVVGDLPEAVNKKITSLRSAATGRLPLVRLDCSKLPQICQALQIASSPTVMLLARAQVAAVLEKDVSPQAATQFVERVAQLLGLKVTDLTQGPSEQLAEAEEMEFRDADAARQMFDLVASGSDLTSEAQMRAMAGKARCDLRQGKRDVAEKAVKELEASGFGRTAEVKQALAMLHLDGLKSGKPTCGEAMMKAVKLFWEKGEIEAFEAGLALLRTDRSEDVRRLAIALVDSLGPRHPRSKAARRSLNNTLFV
eukprot:TRINITY_DN45519_c0_g1_i1.p1 TRINITY_DN45519_c0_g1~~TRINITY_DN45519_c0_g1_i1.p1  ORF type:complete len:365 (-),score=67.87 TRINITY_DN45519_c0_g1_i1:61-1155(-)